MNVAVIGMGYVGATMSVALGLQGHRVVGMDVNKRKINQLKQGKLPFYEGGMEEQLFPLMDSQKLSFHPDLNDLDKYEIVMITVGTPSMEGGAADLSYVEAVANELGRQITKSVVIVIKSTVPVGTCDHVKEIIEQKLIQRGEHISFSIVSNPEFLREGRALIDAMQPERIVIGCDSIEARNCMESLYHFSASKLFFTSIRNAEMIKYASNAFLATKISFVNELARLTEVVGADITDVTKGMGMDSRIGNQFLHAGIGYGGSCFPKDTEALLTLAAQAGVDLSLLQAVTDVNRTQMEWFLNKIVTVLGSIKGKRITVLGLTFKPNTDDIREAPAMRIMEFLLQAGAYVTAYDPKGSESMQQHFPQANYVSSPLSALQNAQAVILATEWPEIVSIDWKQAKSLLANPILIDGRNALQSTHMIQLGYQYVGVGVSLQ